MAKTVSVLLGHGDLNFTRLPDFSTASPHTVSLGDYNGDGKLDLCVANYDDGSVSLCMGRGDGTFTPAYDIPTGAHAHGSIAWDVDGDGLLDLLVVNEAGNTLSVLMGRGDGTFAPKVDFPTDAGAHSIAVGDLNGDGSPDLAISNINANTVNVFLNRRPPVLAARATTAGGSRQLRLMDPKGTWSVTVEAVDGNFRVRDVIPSSLSLISVGTGEVARIGAVPGKPVLVGDRDNDGVEELTASFAMNDLRRLFAPVRGRTDVTATIQGDLLDGRRFRTSFPVTLFFPPGRDRSASVSPNPLNPEATLSFETAAVGRVTVRVYDVRGRLLRTVLDEPALAAGPHSLRIDGHDARGVRLASGVYFFRVIGPEGVSTGRFAILK
jgi:VCBS repeat protein/flagellar hook capping protein FlgD/FG-GAP repeat protein